MLLKSRFRSESSEQGPLLSLSLLSPLLTIAQSPCPQGSEEGAQPSQITTGLRSLSTSGWQALSHLFLRGCGR